MKRNYPLPIDMLHSYNAQLQAEKRSLESQAIDQLFDELNFQNLQLLLNEQIITTDDMVDIVSYRNFANKHGINLKSWNLECRIEASPTPSNPDRKFLYLLMPVEMSFIGSIDSHACFLWWHDADWATKRYINPTRGPYICGQNLGISKFVSITALSPKAMKGRIQDSNIKSEILRTFNLDSEKKSDILTKFGLNGTEWFEKSPELYLITIQCTKDILRMSQPKVPDDLQGIQG